MNGKVKKSLLQSQGLNLRCSRQTNAFKTIPTKSLFQIFKSIPYFKILIAVITTFIPSHVQYFQQKYFYIMLKNMVVWALPTMFVRLTLRKYGSTTLCDNGMKTAFKCVPRMTHPNQLAYQRRCRLFSHCLSKTNLRKI